MLIKMICSAQVALLCIMGLASCGSGDVQMQTIGSGAAQLVSLTITPANLSREINTGQQFTATGTYSDNSTRDVTASATWRTSNAAVATISASGFAATLNTGSSTITAVFGSVSAGATLTVTDIPAEASLAWDAPTTRADGSPATGLAGFRIYFGTSPGAYTGSIDVGNVTTVPMSVVSAAVPAPGIYFLAVTAYYTDTSESGYSNEVRARL